MTPRFAVRAPLVLFLAASLLVACSSAPPAPQFPDLRFTDKPPLQLAVASVDLREVYLPPGHAPNVDHLFPVTPVHAVESWAHDRLIPTGSGPLRAVMTIEDASVIETDLAKQTGVNAWFNTQQSERYDLSIAATVNIVDPTGLVVRSATVKTTRSQTVLENASPNQRDHVFYDMTKAAMADFDQRMESEMRSHFGDYLR